MKIDRSGSPDVFAAVMGRGGEFAACFPNSCSGPVTGALYVTVSRCQWITSSLSVTVQDQSTDTVYPAWAVPATTLAFDAKGAVVEGQLRPWIERVGARDLDIHRLPRSKMPTRRRNLTICSL